MTAENRSERCADRPALVAVVGNPELHEQRAEVGVAEAEGPEPMTVLGDLLRRVARVVDRDVHGDDQDANRLTVAFDVEMALVIEELRRG